MTAADYVRVLRERWIIVAVVVGFALGGAAAVAILRPPVYTATTTLYVSAQHDGDDSVMQAYQGAQLSQERIASYVELVGGRRVANDVIAKLGLRTTSDELRKQISASTALQSVLIEVAVTDRSPQQAARIADAVGGAFTGLVDELERPVDPGVPQTVSVRVVQPAVVPDDPSSMPLGILLALAALGGLGLGVVAAFAQEALDVSVSSPDQLNTLTGVPNLGVVGFDAEVPSRPLIVQEHPQSPRAEAFRALRTNLRFVDLDTRHQVVVVTSSVAGEGKTTTLVNLALASASAGSRVLVIEGDLRRPRTSRLFGLDRGVGLTDVLGGRLPVEEAVQPWGNGAVHVLSSGPLPPNPSEMLGSRQMQNLLETVRDTYDLVLLDTPPLLPVTDAAAVAPSSDGVLFVCRFRSTSRSEVSRAVASLQAVSVPVLGTVFTMVPRRQRAYARHHDRYRTEGEVGQPLPFDDLRRPSPVARPRPAALNGHARNGRETTDVLR